MSLSIERDQSEALNCINYSTRPRAFLATYVSLGLFLYWFLHQFTILDRLLHDIGVQNVLLRALGSYQFYTVLALATLLGLMVYLLILLAEKKLRKTEDDVQAHFGDRVLPFAVTPPLMTLAFAVILIWIDPSLVSIWDTAFISVTIGVSYIGLWLYLAFGPSIAKGLSHNPEVQLRQLNLLHDYQRMLLRAFVTITFVLLVGQVFTVFKVRFQEMLNDPKAREVLEPIALFNAIQLIFMLLGWWALVFARCLKRMEEAIYAMSQVDG